MCAKLKNYPTNYTRRKLHQALQRLDAGSSEDTETSRAANSARQARSKDGTRVLLRQLQDKEDHLSLVHFGGQSGFIRAPG